MARLYRSLAVPVLTVCLVSELGLGQTQDDARIRHVGVVAAGADRPSVDSQPAPRPAPAPAGPMAPIRDRQSAVSNPFKSTTWYVPPPQIPRPPPRSVVNEPTAPQLPFTYLGSYEEEGADTIYIVSNDDRVFDVRVGDVIESTYAVDEVRNGRLVFTYLPLQISQELDLGEFR